MEDGLQAMNHRQNLAVWADRITTCRGSGLSVRNWCRENGLAEGSYYRWQRNLYGELTKKQTFVEVSLSSAAGSTVAATVDLSVRRQCELLGVNRSGLYVAPKQQDEAARLRREEIMSRIDYWHTLLPAIGSRKIVVKLREEGYLVGRKYVRKCMEEMGIHAIYPKANQSSPNLCAKIHGNQFSVVMLIAMAK